MRKVYQNFILIFCFAAILSGCGSGLCPLRTSAGVCASSGGSGWSGAIGVLDTSFGGTGVVSTDVTGTNSQDWGYALALQSDGKIVVCGYSSSAGIDYALVRYNSNGSLDTTFNTTGKIRKDISGSTDYCDAIAIQPDGKIVAAGTSRFANLEFSLLRYNTNGTLDTSFNTTGIVTTIVGTSDVIHSINLQPDGKIIAAGESFGAQNNFAVVRYNTDGSLDTSFNTTGIVTTSIGATYDMALSSALQPNGKIILAGYSKTPGFKQNIALARYNSDGSLDTTFNGTGKVTTTVDAVNDDEADNVLVQPDGKIVASGSSNSSFCVVRYNSNGSLDTTFGTGGIVTTSVFTGADFGRGAALQPDGKIVLVGGSNNQFAIIRYNSNGTLDTTFNGTGIIVYSQSAIDEAWAVNIQPDGKIVVAGQTHPGGSDDIAVLRYR